MSTSEEELKIRDEILQLIDEAIAMNQAPVPHPVAEVKRDHPPRRLFELFEEVEQGVESSLDEMKMSWPDASWSDEQTAAFLRLHDILLALHHWSNDVSSPDYSHEDALSEIENDESDFAPLKEHLRASFESMLSALSQLRERLVGSSQQSHDNIDQHMSELQQLIHELRIFVNPLRTLIESRLEVGRVATVRRRAAELDRMEKAGTLPGQLLDKIPMQYVKSVFDGASQDFAPRGALRQLVVAEAVMAQLKLERPTEANRKLVDFIVSRARRVFAIALQFLGKDELYPAMTIFMNNSFDDEKLPVTRSFNIVTSPSGASFSIEEDALASLSQMDENIWTFGRRTNFDLNQWTFCAPVFSTTTINHDLHEKSILPITYKKEIGAGTFGRVYQVKIQDNHMDDSQNTLGAKPEYFAVKEIIPPTEEERAGVAQGWELEARCLHQMNHRCPQHVLRFYTAFRRGLIHPGHYLICEWADGGNLRDLWRKVQPKPLSASIVREAVQQLLGLALAVHAAHYPPEGQIPIRHGDLKPENILWFKTGGTIGTLKIGDWGLAKEKSIATILQRDPTRTKYGSVRYQPPDVDTEHARSRLYDIWSLGCVMLEFVIWLVKGSAGLDRFHTDLVAGQFENKPFYASLGNGSHKVHDVVVAMMSSLNHDPSCREGSALRDLLDLIREKLLVIALPPEGAERQKSSAPKDTGGTETPQSQQPSTSMDMGGATAPDSSPLSSPSKAEAVARPVDVPVITLDAPTEPPASPVSRPRPPRLLSGPLSVGPYRALAEVIVDELRVIGDKEADNDSYWFSPPSSSEKTAKPAEVTKAAAADYPTSSSDVPSLTFSAPTVKTADSDGSRLFSSGPSIYVDSGMIPISSAGSSRNFASDPSQTSDALEQEGLLAPGKKQIIVGSNHQAAGAEADKKTP